MTSFDQPFAYTGREWDAATGLYHYRARAYDAETGRFLQEDPAGVVFSNLETVLDDLKSDISRGDIGKSGNYDRLGSYPTHNINPYRYVENNPLKYVDHFGELPFNQIDGFKRGMALSNSIRYGMKKLSGKSLKFAARALARSVKSKAFKASGKAECALGVAAALAIGGPASGFPPGSEAQRCYTATKITVGVGALLGGMALSTKNSVEESKDRFREEWNKYDHSKPWNF